MKFKIAGSVLEDKAEGGVCALKSWPLNRKVGHLALQLDDSAKSETRIDINCLTESENTLLDRVQETIDKYALAIPLQDVISKNADLCCKGLSSVVGLPSFLLSLFLSP